MRRYLVRRFLNMIPTLLLVSLGVFALVRWLPSDPARLLAGVDESGAIDPVLYAKIKHDLGLDQPVLVQYGAWLAKVVRGHWGKSYLSGMEVFPQIMHRLHFTAVSSGCLGLRPPTRYPPRHRVSGTAQLANRYRRDGVCYFRDRDPVLARYDADRRVCCMARLAPLWWI